jgi:hypothetical protein
MYLFTYEFEDSLQWTTSSSYKPRGGRERITSFVIFFTHSVVQIRKLIGIV